GAAYLFYALLFLAGAYLIRHYSIIGIKEKNEIELRKVDREKAEELNRLKLQFFTNISHELRTPLSLISGPLESLMNREPYVAPNQRREYYRLMQKNVGYLLRLVDELLDFRRLDQGMIDLNVRQSDLVSFLEEITAPFRFEAERDGIDFRLLAAERPFRVPFDPKVLEKVVFNLLANAFKFTGPAGSITLEVTKVSDDRFRIQVSDTGTGISTEAQGHIFERFYKSGQGNRTNQQGSGIGLAFTKSLVTLHQGEIGVNSEVGQGTTFHVLLPLHPEAYAPGELAPAPETVLPQAANPIDSLPVGPENTEDDRPCVLYVDDNADLRAYLHASLSDEFHVLTADNGRTGVKLARETFPDLIVSDLMMPEMDGMEVLQALKSDSLTSHIPILLLTAKNNDESRLRGLRYGADAYLTKPFREDTLKQRIHNIVNHRDKLRDRFRREVIMEPEEVTVTDLDEIFLRRAVEVVEENISNTNFSVDQLGREMRVSRSHLYLKLKALTGQSASGFIRSIRLKRAVQLFDNTNYSIKEIRYRAGFNTPSYFSKCFKQEYGITPGEYYRQRKQASLND
ncbi:MAG: ATP-binding protein, partial [Bacteroidota bacterium]